jgi:hypothetical protein
VIGWTGLLSQTLEIALALALAPLLTGWVNQCRAWLQNRAAPPLLQPYYLLHKLFHKESVVAEHASPPSPASPGKGAGSQPALPSIQFTTTCSTVAADGPIS